MKKNSDRITRALRLGDSSSAMAVLSNTDSALATASTEQVQVAIQAKFPSAAELGAAPLDSEEELMERIAKANADLLASNLKVPAITLAAVRDALDTAKGYKTATSPGNGSLHPNLLRALVLADTRKCVV